MSPPSKTVAPPSNFVMPIALKKSVGAGESHATRKDGELSQDGRFRWSAGWGKWIPAGKGTLEASNPDLSENQILGIAALVPIRHSPSCLCGACMTAGQRFSDYVKAKRLRDEF